MVEDCHPHDRKWIIEQLRKVSERNRDKIAQQYSETYRETQNRKECNLRLLNYIEEVERVRNMYYT